MDNKFIKFLKKHIVLLILGFIILGSILTLFFQNYFTTHYSLLARTDGVDVVCVEKDSKNVNKYELYNYVMVNKDVGNWDSCLLYCAKYIIRHNHGHCSQI